MERKLGVLVSILGLARLRLTLGSLMAISRLMESQFLLTDF